MKQYKQTCFYFINSTDIQEYTGLIIEAAKLGHSISVMVFDNMTKKRNFYYYSLAEMEEHFRSLFLLNNISPKFVIMKYGANDNKEYIKDYNRICPDLIFTRDVNKVKYILWKPIMDRKKTIMFVWEAPETKVDHKSLMTIARYNNGDINWATNPTIVAPTKLRYASPDHANLIDQQIIQFCSNEKTCFMAETWSRGTSDKNDNLPMILDAIKAFKNAGYKIAWKMREKGYPAQANKTHNYVEEVSGLVDLVIKKDLNYPSSLYFLTKNCDVSCTFNVTTSALDTMHLSPKRFVFLSKHLSAHYRDKLRPGSVSWGKLYENLNLYVHLYDEKTQQVSIIDFITERLSKDMDLVTIDDTDFSHKNIMQEIHRRMNW